MSANRAGTRAWIGIGLALAMAFLALSLLLATGNARAQSGSIAGTVTYLGGAAPGTYDLNVDLFTALDQPPVAGVGLSAAGPFQIFNVIDGNYYVCGTIDPHQPYPNPITCYDPDDDGQPNQVTVSGGAVTGIDLTLGGPWLPLEGPTAPGGMLTALAVHPGIANTLYAALVPKGAHYYTGPFAAVFKSTDGAASWTQVLAPDLGIYALAAADSMVYAGAYDYYGGEPTIYVSHDSGASWTAVFSYPHTIAWTSAAIDPGNSQVAMLGGYLDDADLGLRRGMVYRTGDGGLTWTPVLTPSTSNAGGAVYEVLIHPMTPTLWLASVYDELTGASTIYRSPDAGFTWPYSSTLPDAAANSLAVHPAQPGTLYAGAGWEPLTSGSQSRVFRSTDAGLSWTLVFTQGGLVAVEPVSGTVYALQATSLFSSTAGGDPGTWSYAGGIPDSLTTAFALDSGINPATLYAGGFFWGVSSSTDGGRNWQTRHNGIAMLETIADIELDPRHPERLFVAGETGWRTADGGQSWDYVIGAFPDFAIHPANSNVVLVGVSSDTDRTILRSNDGGLSFTPVYTPAFLLPGGAGGSMGIGDVKFAPSSGDVVYAAGGQNPGWQGRQAVVLRSDNAGLNWTEILTRPTDSNAGALAVDPTDPNVLYAGIEDCQTNPCEYAIYRTQDGGLTWQKTLTRTVGYFIQIVVDPQKPEVVYAGADFSDVYKSTDGGSTWTLVRTCCPLGNFPTLDPRVPSHVYVIGNTSFAGESRDGGLTWSGAGTPLCQGAPRQNSGTLELQNDGQIQTLYGGFSGLWVYRRAAPQPGLPVTVTPALSEPSAPVGETVQVGGLVLDGNGNWVADGTVVTFTTSAAGTFDPLLRSAAVQSSPVVTRAVVDGHVWATLRGVQNGIAVVTLTANNVSQSIEVVFGAISEPGARYVDGATGQDVATCGESATPCATLSYTLNSRAVDGDSLFVAAGLYRENPTINGITVTLRGGYTLSGTQWLTDTGETIIDGNAAGRALTLQGSNAVLENLTLTGGQSPAGECWGGGMWISNGNVTIRSSRVTANVAGCSGGGIEVNSDLGPAHLTLEDSIVDHNLSGGHGGGITLWHASATLINTQVLSNTADDGTNGFAGGIGIYQGSQLAITGSSIRNNAALLHGGAIEVRNSTLSITNTLIVSNTATNINVLAIDNSAVAIQNCTLADNNPQGAQAILAFDPPTSTLTIRNSILWNSALSIQWDGPTDTLSVAHTDIQGGWAGAGNFNADPLFAGAGNYHLQPSSPCIDQGTPVGAPTTDIEGSPRDARPDMGAYEWQGFRIYLPLTLRNF